VDAVAEVDSKSNPNRRTTQTNSMAAVTDKHHQSVLRSKGNASLGLRGFGISNSTSSDWFGLNALRKRSAARVSVAADFPGPLFFAQEFRHLRLNRLGPDLVTLFVQVQKVWHDFA
jgi:hypothetical protein